MKKILFFVVIFISLIVLLTLRLYDKKKITSPITTQIPTSAPQEKTSIIAENLNIPWELVFLPDQSILFTERVGNLKILKDKKASLVAKIPDVKVYGEGGLLGLALSPNFSSNHYIFLYYTFSGKDNKTLNRVVRYKFINDEVSDQKILVNNIPGAIYHNGGRIKFGPDKYLYITTGDSRETSLAQNKNSLAGKILRVDEDGMKAPDNPFNNQVFSYGHRNPQGLAWDNQGRLWATEHGPTSEFGLCCRDEINIIIKGHNYGWPTITGNQTKTGMDSPFAQSGNLTWAPSGATFFEGRFFFAGLKGQALLELKTDKNLASINEYFKDEFGRIRDVVVGPDNFLYLLTSNMDGRGTIHTGDDKIIKVDPSQL